MDFYYVYCYLEVSGVDGMGVFIVVVLRYRYVCSVYKFIFRVSGFCDME